MWREEAEGERKGGKRLREGGREGGVVRKGSERCQS